MSLDGVAYDGHEEPEDEEDAHEVDGQDGAPEDGDGEVDQVPHQEHGLEDDVQVLVVPILLVYDVNQHQKYFGHKQNVPEVGSVAVDEKSYV